MTRPALAGLVLAGLATPATADAPRDAPTEIEVDRSDTPPGRTEFAFDGGAPVSGWGATLAGGWLEGPISFGLLDGTGRRDVEPVRRRQTAWLGGALALGNSAVVDARFAVAHQVGDRLRGTGDERRLDRFVPTDLKIGARLRVLGKPVLSVFVRGDLTLPTGDQHDFAGEAGYSLAWRLIGRFTLPHDIVIAATAGLRLRGEEVLVGDRLVGNEVLAAGGIAIPIPPIRPLWCTADQVRITAEVDAVVGDDVGVGRGPSPIEAKIGLVTKPRPSWTIGVRVGRGLTDEIGSPDLRATVELTYQGSWKLLEIEHDDRDDDSRE